MYLSDPKIPYFCTRPPYPYKTFPWAWYNWSGYSMLFFCAACFLLLSSFLLLKFSLLLIIFTNHSLSIGLWKSIPAYDSNSPSPILVNFFHVCCLLTNHHCPPCYHERYFSEPCILFVTEYTNRTFGETIFFVGNHNTNAHCVLCLSCVH
jgi:hypothetical protein